MLIQGLGPTTMPLGMILWVLSSNAAERIEIPQAQQSSVNTAAPLRLQWW